MDISCFTPLWGVWEIDTIIGQGSYGKVYRAKRTEYEKTYYSAIKHISIPSSQSEVESLFADGVVNDSQSLQAYYDNMLQRLMREIDINVSLKGHTNIVSYEDHMVVPRKEGPGFDVFIRMELLTPLPQLLQQRAITENEVRRLGIDICSALEVMGRHNILHRDIKPSNIFVSSSGDYKIGDFGVSRTMDSAANGVTMAGTLNYMAPELNHGQNVSLRSDMYSLGLVLYRLCNANRAPFVPLPPLPATADMMEASNTARFSGRPLPAPAYASPELAAIILKTCEFNPEDRFLNAAELKRALLGGPIQSIERQKESSAPQKSKSKLWLIPVIIASIAIIVLIAAIVILLTRIKDDPSPSEDNSYKSQDEDTGANINPADTPEPTLSPYYSLEENSAEFIQLREGIGYNLEPDESYLDICIPQFLQNSNGVKKLNEQIIADYSHIYEYSSPVIEVITYELIRNNGICSIVITETYAERNDPYYPYSTFHSDYSTFVNVYHFDENTGEYITSPDYANKNGLSESYVMDAYYSQYYNTGVQFEDLQFYLTDSGTLMFGGPSDLIQNVNATFHDYELIREDITWDSANRSAMYKGGHLATITSDDEFNLIVQLVSDMGCSFCWLGGRTEIAVDGGVASWWITGESMPDKYWCVTEPSGTDGERIEDCILLWYLEKYGWTFNDVMNDPFAYEQLKYYKNNTAYAVEYGDGYTGYERP